MECGRYRDANEILIDAFQALTERDRLDALETALAEGDAQFKRGEGVAGTPDFWDRLQGEADEIVRLGKPIKDVVRL